MQYTYSTSLTLFLFTLNEQTFGHIFVIFQTLKCFALPLGCRHISAKMWCDNGSYAMSREERKSVRWQQHYIIGWNIWGYFVCLCVPYFKSQWGRHRPSFFWGRQMKNQPRIGVYLIEWLGHIVCPCFSLLCIETCG